MFAILCDTVYSITLDARFFYFNDAKLDHLVNVKVLDLSLYNDQVICGVAV